MSATFAPTQLQLPEQTFSGLDAISDYVFAAKYANYLPEKQRRETWEEAVDRVLQMHIRRFNHRLNFEDMESIRWAFSLVREKKVLASMRSMQFGGKAIEANEARIMNCSVTHVDSIRSFAESFYLLLSGCGVGFGLSKARVAMLPDLVERNLGSETYVIEDSIEGWADSLKVLLQSFTKGTMWSGVNLTLDYSQIRPAGAPLVTSGGIAPGPDGLRRSHEMITKMLTGKTGPWSTLDAFDVLMHTADAVLSGGIRRAATIAIFDADDTDMMNAKTGTWYDDNPQRGRANISARLIRDEAKRSQFDQLFQSTQEFGEPGFFFADNEQTLVNPCAEILLDPITEDGRSGVQFCNLTSINGNKVKGTSDFLEAIRAATIIGTLQADYTNYNYLGSESQEITERDALLGVSITSMMSNPTVLLDSVAQQTAAKLAIEVNERWAKKIGINPAARVTAIKPEGSSTLVVGSLASGIHPAHAHNMWRRVQANKLEPIAQAFAEANPHLVEESVWSANNTDVVLKFPIELDPTVMVKADLEGVRHLEIIKSTQKNYVKPGTTRGKSHHNVSCTVIVAEDEWATVADYIWDYRDDFTAVSLLAASGDRDFQQAPNEAIQDDTMEAFRYDLAHLVPVDYTTVVEYMDNTAKAEELSCSGGACELV